MACLRAISVGVRPGPKLVRFRIKGTWKPGYKEFGLKMGPEASSMVICGATAEQKAKLEQIMKDLLDGKIKTLKG